jgi:hypothetical protein
MNTNINTDDSELLFLSLNQFIPLKKGDKRDKFGFIFPNWCNVSNLKDKLPLSYNDSMILIYYLNLQQEFLERKGYGFFILAIEDIVVIENSYIGNDLDSSNIFKFAYLNPLHIKKINKNNEICFMSPFSIGNGFCSPEILAIDSIPSAVSYKCFYYSLGALIIYCMTSNVINNLSNNNLNMQLENKLELIKGTKLYYSLKRLMIKEPKERDLLFV